MGYYTCAINMAWLNFVWSATPGTPIRESAVELVKETTFKVPTALSKIIAVVPDKDYKVKEDKGALMRVSPEELTTAFVLAVARDIAKGEADDVLQQWKYSMLSTTCKFVLPFIPMGRYWAALKERENISATFKACVRSCYQRLHEVVRLMEAMRQRLAESKVTTELVLVEQKNHQHGHDQRRGHLARFPEGCPHRRNRMLAVPEIAKIVREADCKSLTSFNPGGITQGCKQ